MNIEISGDVSLPKILLIHPLGTDGTIFTEFMALLGPKYCYLVVTLDGHGCQVEQDFPGVVQQATQIKDELITRGFTKLELVLGLSLGAALALALAGTQELQIVNCVLDGAPLIPGGALNTAIETRKMISLSAVCRLMPKFALNTMKKSHYDYAQMTVEGMQRVSSTTLKNMVRSCKGFEFPHLSAEAQQRMFVRFGQKEPHVKAHLIIRNRYPAAVVELLPDSLHCQEFFGNVTGYTEWVKHCIDS